MLYIDDANNIISDFCCAYFVSRNINLSSVSVLKKESVGMDLRCRLKHKKLLSTLLLMTSRFSPSTIIVAHGEFVGDIIMREREKEEEWEEEGRGGREWRKGKERGERKERQINETQKWETKFCSRQCNSFPLLELYLRTLP